VDVSHQLSRLQRKTSHCEGVVTPNTEKYIIIPDERVNTTTV
jgi:hypothetical protein